MLAYQDPCLLVFWRSAQPRAGFLLDPYLPIFRVRTEDASIENIELGSEGGAAAALAGGKVPDRPFGDLCVSSGDDGACRSPVA